MHEWNPAEVTDWILKVKQQLGLKSVDLEKLKTQTASGAQLLKCVRYKDFNQYGIFITHSADYDAFKTQLKSWKQLYEKDNEEKNKVDMPVTLGDVERVRQLLYYTGPKTVEQIASALLLSQKSVQIILDDQREQNKVWSMAGLWHVTIGPPQTIPAPPARAVESTFSPVIMSRNEQTISFRA
jgi:hypothetical protein